ncbi:MAG: hypothetical protein ABW198_06220 [Pseudorhodoplanes sp.]
MGTDGDSAKDRKATSIDPDRDTGHESTSRDLVPLVDSKPNKSFTRSRLTDTLFLAHLFATRFQDPQTREKRRAEPSDANASYRKGAKRPTKTGRLLSKKV